MVSYKQLAERGLSTARSSIRDAGRLARYGAGVGIGAARRVTRPFSRPKAGMDDVTLARKVETEIFREAGTPKGSVNVNAVDGVVELRGEAKTPEMIRELVRRAEGVPEVRGVENLLHLPKTPARRQRTRAATGSTPRRNPRRVNAEKGRADAEPTPDEVAAERQGRQPAPLGNTRDRR